MPTMSITADEIEEQILAESDFDVQLEIFSAHYSIVKKNGRLTTGGTKDVKLFCQCNTCSKESGFLDKKSVYDKYLSKELKEVVSKLNSFVEYKDRLNFYDKYFDINGTYYFEVLDITLSARPTNPAENKVYNELQYDRFLQRYFVTDLVSMKTYYQRDFNSLRRLFNAKKINSTYPDQAASKEITALNKYFEGHWNTETRDLYTQLNDGHTVDFSSGEFEFQKYLVIIEALEGVKFLRYLENVNRASSSFTKTFHEVIQQSHEAYKSYSVVTWNLIRACVQEMKDKLYELNNDDNRVAYLKTTLLSFKILGFEDYFKEVEAYLCTDTKVNQGFEATGNVVSVTSAEKYSPLYEGVASIIKGRDSIVLDISEHVADVYPLIDFTEIMNAVDYRTKETFWIGSGKLAGQKLDGLTNREKAKLYLYEVDFKISPKLNVKDFNEQYSKNIELAKNDIFSKRKPATRQELQNILGHLKIKGIHSEIQDKIIQDIAKLPIE